MRSGVQELWFVYPQAKRVEVYRLEESPDAPTASHSLGATFRSPLFPDLEITTDAIFQR